MPDHALSSGRRALVFAPLGDPLAAALPAALGNAGIAVESANSLSHGLGLLCRPQANGSRPDLVIVLGSLAGLSAMAIAKAVRSLPGLSELPLIVVGSMPPGLAVCAALTQPSDIAAICGYAAQDPQTWRSAPVQAPAATVLVADAVFDPGPLQRLEAAAPGSSREILASMGVELLEAQSAFPDLLRRADLGGLAKAAHRLKGSSGTIGASALSQACAILERHSRAGDQAASTAATPAVLTAIDNLAQRLTVSVQCASNGVAALAPMRSSGVLRSDRPEPGGAADLQVD